MLIDTHCHLDAPAFDQDRRQVMAAAVTAGVRAIVIPAVSCANFQAVRDVAHAMPGGAYALGIHPCYVQDAQPGALVKLRAAVELAMSDIRFVAIGEIGLDFFIANISCGKAREKQEHYYAAQLALAAEFGLPVLLHVRRSQDIILKYVRRQAGLCGGIAHAFNGSLQQAQIFIDYGFALGMGGAMTFSRALQIRRHAQYWSLAHLVLETDAPDMAPSWLHEPHPRNTPAQIAGVAQALATLRDVDSEDVAATTAATALRRLPRLAAMLA